MKDSKIKIFLMLAVSLLVITILLSNIGQNFKTNISSYENTLKYFKSMSYFSDKAKYYQNYLNSSSNYITKLFRVNNFQPLINNKFVDSWDANIPVKLSNSSLEVYDSNMLVRKYNAGTDFIEDFRGNIVPGTVKSKATYESNLASIHNVLTEILLFDGYTVNDSPESISSVDSKLKSLGASGIISPILTNNPLVESGYFSSDLINIKKGKGIAKFLVTQNVFNELKVFMQKGYIIKIKSGGEISPVVYKNVYGMMEGNNKSFKPLIIGVFLDGTYKFAGKKLLINKNYLLSTAVSLDCIRVVNKQRLRKPDRTIIFAFLSGYSQDRIGLKRFLESYPHGSSIVLEGMGLNDNYILSYNKSSANEYSTVSYFLKKANFIISSKDKDNIFANNVIIRPSANMDLIKEITRPGVVNINNSAKFILNLIQDECYNLNLITGNIRQFRAFERYIRNNSAWLSLIAFIFLILIIFLPFKKRKE